MPFDIERHKTQKKLRVWRGLGGSLLSMQIGWMPRRWGEPAWGVAGFVGWRMNALRRSGVLCGLRGAFLEGWCVFGVVGDGLRRRSESLPL